MRGIKWSIESVREYIESQSDCKLLSVRYINTDSKLEIMCQCGRVFHKSFQEIRQLDRKMCRECILQNNSIYNIDNVKHFVEIESGSGCKLLSTVYKNVDTKMSFKCPCGEVFMVPYKHFQKGKRICNPCAVSRRIQEHSSYTHEFVEQELEKLNFKLLSKYRNCKSSISISCANGHVFKRSFDEIKRRPICSTCFRQDEFEKRKLKLISKIQSKGLNFISWIGNYDKTTELEFIVECSSGHLFKTNYNNINAPSQTYCRECGKDIIIKKNTKGLSPLYDYLRRTINVWKRDSMIACDYKCDISNGEFDAVHHLYGFNLILKETVEQLNLPLRKIIGEYSEEELKLVTDKCFELHEKYGLGVCLRADIHTLFHRIYGKANNTPEQYYEFKIRYLNGEFTEESVAV